MIHAIFCVERAASLKKKLPLFKAFLENVGSCYQHFTNKMTIKGA